MLTRMGTMEPMGEEAAKVGRRGFFGRAFGGFLAAVGLGKVAGADTPDLEWARQRARELEPGCHLQTSDRATGEHILAIKWLDGDISIVQGRKVLA